MLLRLQQALSQITAQVGALASVAGVLVFGSYARGEHGRTSDVDLLVLFEGPEPPEATDVGATALRIIGELESAARLPMHISPLLASVDRPEDLGPELIHSIWTDGIILHGRAAALARLRPPGLSPAAIVRFTLKAAPAERVRLSRRLHGVKGRGGILGPGALTLGRGALLVPATQQTAVRQAMDEAGATYDVIPVWREG